MIEAPPDVARAIDELQARFGERLEVVATDGGGARIRIAAVELSERWAPASGELWFQIPYHYPDAPIYPYYVTEATPVGGLVPALQAIQWESMPATQVSLRHNSWDPEKDSAVGSVLQAMDWLRTQ